MLYRATAPDETTSLCVLSDGSYGIEAGLICSLPCTTDGRGDWKIRPGLELDEFCRKKVEISVAELREERDTVRHLLA